MTLNSKLKWCTLKGNDCKSVSVSLMTFINTLVRPSEPPELILDAGMTREVKAMAGTHITLMATIKGVPFPTVTWKKNDAEVPTRADIETNQTGTKLEMRFCHRGDSGDYTLTVENPAGSKTVTCTVLVLGEKFGSPFC